MNGQTNVCKGVHTLISLSKNMRHHEIHISNKFFAIEPTVA